MTTVKAAGAMHNHTSKAERDKERREKQAGLQNVELS